MTKGRATLRAFIEKHCLEVGSTRTLSTGGESMFYFDCKRAMLNAATLRLIAQATLEEIDHLPVMPDMIAGPAMGANFIVAGVIVQATLSGRKPTIGAIVQTKRNGDEEHSTIENEPGPGTMVVVVDDVITTGASTVRACDALLETQATIVGIVTIIDREAGGKEGLEQRYGCPVRSIFAKSDFEIGAHT